MVVDTLKPAEEGTGLILRLYESHGSHVKAALTSGEAPRSVQHMDLLEQPASDDIGLDHKGAKVIVRLKPFQIVTLRITEAS